MAIVHQQDSSIGLINSGSTGSGTVSFSANTKPGSLLMLWIQSTSSSMIPTVSDPINGTYTLAFYVLSGSMWFYYFPNAASLLAGTNITVSYINGNGGGTQLDYISSEFSGVSSTNSLNLTNNNSGTGSPISVTGTPSVKGCVFLASANNGNGSDETLTSPGWTAIIANPSGSGSYLAYIIATDSTSQTATWTFGGAFTWSGMIIAFQPPQFAQGLGASITADYQVGGGFGF